MLDWKLQGSNLQIGDEIYEPTTVRTLGDLDPVVESPQETKTDEVYRVFRDVPDPDSPPGQRADITIIKPGLIGTEYCKTHGHYHLGDGVEVYRVLAGTGVFVMQKPGFNYETVEAVRIVRLIAGQSLEVPTGWGHTMVNVGQEPLVAINYELPTLQNLYPPFAEKHGAAYYIQNSGGGFEAMPNPNYGEVPKPQTF